MNQNKVPPNLFPISERSLTTEWAMDTYQYRVFFNSAIDVNCADDEDLREWISEDKKLIGGLKRDGIMYADKEIVHLCNNVYASQLNDRYFQNKYEVLEIFKDKTFVSENYSLYLDMLHMFQYGIFRCAFNAWAEDVADSWMRSKNLSYIDDYVDDKPKTRPGKGFAYKLLVNRASNTICVRFQQLTQNLYQEYVMVRERKDKQGIKQTAVVPYTFNHSYQGYVVQCADKYNPGARNILSKEEREALIRSACKAISNGKTIVGIINVIDKYGNDLNESK